MSSVERLSDEQIEARLRTLEGMIARAQHPDDLAALNRTFQRLLDEQVRRDLDRQDKGD